MDNLTKSFVITACSVVITAGGFYIWDAALRELSLQACAQRFGSGTLVAKRTACVRSGGY